MNLNVDVGKRLGTFQLNTAFQVEGDQLGLFGPSGHGKSTLINLLAGLHSADDGFIQLNGDYLYHSTLRINLAPRRRRIAVVFQNAHLFPHYSVKGNLLYGYNRLRNLKGKIKPDAVIDALNIDHLLSRSIDGLSGGERQRVALGRALLANPRLLILDEPLSALDHSLKKQIIPFLRQTLKHFAIPYLYISHSLSEMRLLSRDIIVLNRGRVDRITTAEELSLRLMGSNPRGYINHIELTSPRQQGTLLAYRWGEQYLLVTPRAAGHEGIFELPGRQILLFRNNPGATSARNLFEMPIRALTPLDNCVAVTLGETPHQLISQVMYEAAEELNLQVGGRVYVAIKASSVQPLA
ncbi:MAG: molybdenum ABC transporter ATP-binding protein [Desulfuromonadaceae bacterium]|nr:molybdenum ABC transporter ATP-binding protein [Desulfuromonadaceae bacterium]